MSDDSRLTWGLITGVIDVLKHGCHRTDGQHAGRAVGLASDLAAIYEGTLEAPAGARVVPEPATAVTSVARRTILAALDEAAEHKRDLAANCADCADQSCGSCEFRLAAAREYEGVASQLLPRESRRDMEAGQ